MYTMCLQIRNAIIYGREEVELSFEGKQGQANAVSSFETLSTFPNGIFMRLYMYCLFLLIIFHLCVLQDAGQFYRYS